MAERFPKDFNGILAGAPANIMTELNSILHEYEFDVVLDKSGHGLLDAPEATIVLNGALKKCDPKVGLMLDYRGCQQQFKLNSVEGDGYAGDVHHRLAAVLCVLRRTSAPRP